jgi:hypothetical protein
MEFQVVLASELHQSRQEAMRFAIVLAVLIAVTVAIVSTGGLLIVLLIRIAGSAGAKPRWTGRTRNP